MQQYLNFNGQFRYRQELCLFPKDFSHTLTKFLFVCMLNLIHIIPNYNFKLPRMRHPLQILKMAFQLRPFRRKRSIIFVIMIRLTTRWKRGHLILLRRNYRRVQLLSAALVLGVGMKKRLDGFIYHEFNIASWIKITEWY